MNKIKKSIFSFVLALAMVFTLMPMNRTTVLAATSYTINFNARSQWSVDSGASSAVAGDTIVIKNNDSGLDTGSVIVYIDSEFNKQIIVYPKALNIQLGNDYQYQQSYTIPEGKKVSEIDTSNPADAKIYLVSLHECSLGAKTVGQAATCIENGWNDYYQCTESTCGKIYAANDTSGTAYADLDEWKASEAGKIEKLGHEWGYTANGAELKASCSRKATCGQADVTLTLSAPNTNYSGKSAVIVVGTNGERSAWTGAGLSVPENRNITYETSTGTDLGTTVPTAAGSYVAKISPVGVIAKDDNTAKVSYTIHPSTESITLNKTTTSLKVGETETLTATVSPDNAYNKNVKWEAGNNSSIASVNESGVITAVSVGTTTITARTEDGGATATCTVTVTPETYAVTIEAAKNGTVSISSLPEVENGTGFSDEDNILTIGETQIIATPNSGYSFGFWDYEGEVSQNNIVGAVTFKAYFVQNKPEWLDGLVAKVVNASPNLASVSDEGTLTVLSNMDIGIDKLIGYMSVFEYSVNGTVYTLDGMISASEVTIDITLDSNEDVVGVTLTLNGDAMAFEPYTAVTGVTLNKETTSIKVGGEETLTATVAPNNATVKGVTWKSDNTDIATVDENGKVTAVSAGTAVVTATTADGSFTASCTVTVNPLTFDDVKDKIIGAYEYGGSVWNVSETGISLSWLNNFDLVISQARNLEISENENSIDIKLKAIIFDWELKFNIESGKAVSLVEDRSSVYKLAGDYNYDGNTLTITGDGTLSGIMVETALYSHPEITKVVVSGYEEIYYAAFYNCPTTVTSVSIGDSVKTIVNYAFYKCESLESVDLGNGVETIGKGAFQNTGLKEVTIPDSVKTIDEFSFYNCLELETINLGNGVNEIGNAAFAYAKIDEIIIPENVTNIGEGAFGYNIWDQENGKDLPSETFTIKGHGTYDSEGKQLAAYKYFSTYKGANWKYINLDAAPTTEDSEFAVSGKDASLTYITGKAEESTLHIDGVELSYLHNYVQGSDAYTGDGIYVTCDGKEVTMEGNYTVTEGSVKVTFTEKFLNDLPVGSHTIKTYLNGTETATADKYDYVFNTVITVKAKPSTGGGSSTTPTATPTYKVPNTSVGQDINPMNKTIGLLSIALVAGCVARKKKED